MEVRSTPLYDCPVRSGLGVFVMGVYSGLTRVENRRSLLVPAAVIGFKLWAQLYWPWLLALDQVQQVRVRELRDSRRRDSAFALYFNTYEEAKLADGVLLAGAWARMRALEEEKFLPAAAAALESRSSASSFSFRGPSSKADLPISKRSTVRVMKPTGQILKESFPNGKTGVTRRLSQENFTHADKATVINAVRTYAELKHFMAARDREMPPEELDLRPFLGHWHGRPSDGFQFLAVDLSTKTA